MLLEGVERFDFFFAGRTFRSYRHVGVKTCECTEVSLGNGVKKISHFLG